jgi:tetratricopeptide (TPR) repeat protein
MVPEFTVVVRPVSDEPELILRRRFANGLFVLHGLENHQYQIQILSPRYAKARLDIDFQQPASDTNFRVVVLHDFDDKLSRESLNTTWRVSTNTRERKVPENAMAAYQRAVRLQSDGKLEEALVAYGDSLRACPEFIQALADIGAVYNFLDRPDAALPYLRRAQDMDPSNEVINLNMAITLLAKQRFSDSENILSSLAQNGNVDGNVRELASLYLAELYFREKKYAEAAGMAEKALNLDPTLVDARLLLVNVALEQMDFGTARKALRRLSETMNNRLFRRFVDDQITSLGQ